MENDFNTNYKNYLNYSKVYQKIKRKVIEDDSYQMANEAERREYLIATKAVMQYIITDPSCLKHPNFKNHDIVCLLKDNNSNDIKEHYVKHYEHKLDHDGFFIKGLISVFFSRNAYAVSKGTETCLIEELLKEKENFKPDYESPAPKKMKA